MKPLAAQDYTLGQTLSPAKRKLFRRSMQAFRINQIKHELRSIGAVAYNFWLPETHYLPSILHNNEHIKGAVYGRYSKGRGVLVATDQRVLFIDKKPLFLHCDEITFTAIDGVTYTRVSFMGTITLHTNLGDYHLRTFNDNLARNFVKYIEEHCLQSSQNRSTYNYVIQKPPVPPDED